MNIEVRRSVSLSLTILSSLSGSRWINGPALVVAGYGLLWGLAQLAEESLLQIGLAAVLTLLGLGYSLSAVLFPRATDLDPVERLAVAGGLSLATGGMMGFALARSPWGLGLEPLLVCSLAFNLGCYVAVLYRRRTSADTSPDWELAGHLRLSLLPDWWGKQNRNSQRLTAALVLLLLTGGIACGAALLKDSPDPPMTEFFLLDEKGQMDTYPSDLPAGQWLTLRYGITNREGTRAQYWVSAELGGEVIGRSETAVLEASETKQGQIWVLAPKNTSDTVSGAGEVRVILHKDDQPYRSLHLWLALEKPPLSFAVGR